MVFDVTEVLKFVQVLAQKIPLSVVFLKKTSVLFILGSQVIDDELKSFTFQRVVRRGHHDFKRSKFTNVDRFDFEYEPTFLLCGVVSDFSVIRKQY